MSVLGFGFRRAHGPSSGSAKRRLLKYERAAMRWLRRYVEEKEPTFGESAMVVRSLEQRQLDAQPARLAQMPTRSTNERLKGVSPCGWTKSRRPQRPNIRRGPASS